MIAPSYLLSSKFSIQSSDRHGHTFQFLDVGKGGRAGEKKIGPNQLFLIRRRG
jgi:hypothetical protein